MIFQALIATILGMHLTALEEGKNLDIQTLAVKQSNVITASDQAPQFIGAIPVELDRCNALSEQKVDCTDEIKNHFPEAPSPMLGKAVFEIRKLPDGRIASLTGACRLIEILTITKQLALEASSFVGIGFYTAQDRTKAQIDLIPAAKLHAIGNARLASKSSNDIEESVVIHRFIEVAFCSGQGGNTGAIMRQSLEFLPFAQYETRDESSQLAHIYRRWEDVSPNHRITNQLNGFDRQTQLLK